MFLSFTKKKGFAKNVANDANVERFPGKLVQPLLLQWQHNPKNRFQFSLLFQTTR
jgi:hypothetical protein